MNQNNLIWIIPLTLAVGIIIGIFVLPKNIEIKLEVVNSTRNWLDEGNWYKPLLNYTQQNWTNMCCFPSDCPEASKNPKRCTCVYMVECFNESEENDWNR